VLNNKSPFNLWTIFLIKEDLQEDSDVLNPKFRSTLRSHTVSFARGQTGNLYVKNGFPVTPKWAKVLSDAVQPSLEEKSQTHAAVLLVESAGGKFGITFGFGKGLLRPGAWEQDFGLVCVLNTIDEDSVREIELSGFDALLQNKQAQSVRNANLAEFEFNIDQDVLRSVRGTPKDLSLGRHLSGRDSLHISSDVAVEALPDLLERVLLESKKTVLLERFSWINRMKEVRSPAEKASLNDLLEKKLQGENLDRAWLAPPEYTRWKDGSAFRYPLDKTRYFDIHLKTFLGILKNKGRLEALTVKALKRWHIEILDENDFLQDEWPVFRSLYAEVEVDGSTFLLSNEAWYKIEKDFLSAVNEEIQAIPLTDYTLPPFMDVDENAYNLRISDENSDLCCMDRKPVELKRRGLSKVEFCDLFSRSKNIVHVKRYSGSRELSHLFQQGVVSAELLANESEFRRLINEKLPESHRMKDAEAPIAPSEYAVVYAIISRSGNDLSLPFFSKVVLKNAKRRLSALGFQVRLSKIKAMEPLLKP
jgi:uncharacterized protein (TIGR04141 family)